MPKIRYLGTQKMLFFSNKICGPRRRDDTCGRPKKGAVTTIPPFLVRSLSILSSHIRVLKMISPFTISRFKFCSTVQLSYPQHGFYPTCLVSDFRPNNIRYEVSQNIFFDIFPPPPPKALVLLSSLWVEREIPCFTPI